MPCNPFNSIENHFVKKYIHGSITLVLSCLPPNLSPLVCSRRRGDGKSRPHESATTLTQFPHRYTSQCCCNSSRKTRGFHEPVAVVNLGIVAQQLLLTLLVSQVSTDLIAIFFGLEEGNEVDASPHFLTAEFAVSMSVPVRLLIDVVRRY